MNLDEASFYRAGFVRSVSLAAIAVSVVLLSTAAYADTDGTAPNATSDTARCTVNVSAPLPTLYEVSDVNVGAQDAKDLPRSVQSYTSGLIAGQGTRTLLDVVKNEPSVQDSAVGECREQAVLAGGELCQRLSRPVARGISACAAQLLTMMLK